MVVTRPPLLASPFILPHSSPNPSTPTPSSSNPSQSPLRRSAKKAPPTKDAPVVPVFHFQKAFDVASTHGENPHSPLSPPLHAVLLDKPLQFDVSEVVGEEAGTHLGSHSFSAPYVRSLKALLKCKFDSEEDQDAFNQRQQDIEAVESVRAASHRRKLLHERRDVLSEVGLADSQLIALGIRAGSWVEVHSSGRYCLARVRGMHGDAVRRDSLFLSPFLHFNLGLSELTDDTVRIRKCAPQANSPFQNGLMELEAIPCADNVQISLIRTPSSVQCKSEIQDRGLKAFFSGQPVLKLGQVFGVPIQPRNYWLSAPSIAGEAADTTDEDPTFDDQDDDQNDFFGSGLPLIYFKVTAVEPSYTDFRVQGSVTSLVVSDQVRSRVPYSLESFLAAPPPGSDSSLIPEVLTPGLQPSFEELTAKLRPFLHPVTCTLRLTSALLLCGPRRGGKRQLVSHAARRLGVHLIEKNSYELLGATESATAENLRALFTSAKTFAPVIVHCRRLGAFKDKTSQKGDSDSLGAVLGEILTSMNLDTLEGRDPLPVLFVGSCEKLDEVPTCVKVLFTHTLAVGEAPDLPLRNQLFHHFLQGIRLQESLEHTSSNLASRTAGLSSGEIGALIADASRIALERGQLTTSRQHDMSKKMQALRSRVGELTSRSRARTEKKLADEESTAEYTASLSLRDFEQALNDLQQLSQNATATAKIPDVRWSDVGGLQHVKREVMETVELPLKQPGLFASGIKQRKGILLYGPPGTGKTLIAKAVANECSLNFISVKGPELLNMYIGESEKNIRDVFARARSCKPCVLFFDEIDSLAPARGHGSNGGGVMDRVVSSLLTEMDGMGENKDVFIIAATNRPDLLDSALLRPGRLDRCVYLGVGDSPEQQLNILSALTRKFRLSPDTDLVKLSHEVPLSFSGADLYALCSDAMLYALKRKISQIDQWVVKLNQGHKEPVTIREVLSVLEDSELAITVTMDDFLEAKTHLTPSLSAEELGDYKKLQQKFSSRAIKA